MSPFVVDMEEKRYGLWRLRVDDDDDDDGQETERVYSYNPRARKGRLLS